MKVSPLPRRKPRPAGTSGRCESTGKTRFRDHEAAVDALHRAAAARVRAAADGVSTTRREVGSYECPRCHGWHLTIWPSATTPALTQLAIPA